jgi:hypothetical protein
MIVFEDRGNGAQILDEVRPVSPLPQPVHSAEDQAGREHQDQGRE